MKPLEHPGGTLKRVCRCLITAISSAEYNASETLGTLAFASRCKLVRNNARVNINENGRALMLLREENEKLKAQLQKLQGGGGLAMPQASQLDMCLEELRVLFTQLPKNAEGKVPSKEFEETIASISEDSSVGQFSHLLKILLMDEDAVSHIDADGSGDLDWDELESWIRSKTADPVELERQLLRMMQRRTHLHQALTNQSKEVEQLHSLQELSHKQHEMLSQLNRRLTDSQAEVLA